VIGLLVASFALRPGTDAERAASLIRNGMECNDVLRITHGSFTGCFATFGQTHIGIFAFPDGSHISITHENEKMTNVRVTDPPIWERVYSRVIEKLGL